ncbi:hypothetical protein DITRI_Ditri06bG0131100 [Diplodiscus trichospermus]
MERAAIIKLAFLVALLVIGSCLPKGIEAQGLGQCQTPSDCFERCVGCNAIRCEAGFCQCDCVDGSINQEKPVQCNKPEECVDICHGCTVNKCTAGLCVCGC